MVEIPSDIDLRDRGENSTEKVTQEKREQTAMNALYTSAAHIPESPRENFMTTLLIRDMRGMSRLDAWFVYDRSVTGPCIGYPILSLQNGQRNRLGVINK